MKDRLHWALVGACALVAVLVMAQPLFRADPAYFYFDDFFYYLVPARNFLATGKLFVHPSMPTNGFQPLWMGVIVAISAVARGHAFFVVFNALLVALLAWSCHQAIALVRDAGGGAVAQIAACLVTFAMQLEIATSGMEVALTTPLLLWLTRDVMREPLAERSPRELGKLGLLAAFVVLSRLDSAILLAPVAIFLVARDRPSMRALAWIALGTLPLWIYFVVDRAVFGSFLPISGSAKMLAGPGAPTLAPLEAIALELGKYAVVSPLGYVVVTALALAAPKRDRIFVAAVLGVLAYYATYTVMTDWRLWFWYKYPLAWIAVLGCATLSTSRLFERAALVVSAALAFVALRGERKPEGNWIYAHARAIADFERTHPGSYAMGDCAGSAAYLSHEPLLQTEGLVADRAYLDLVRARTPLGDVLRLYRIDYYAAIGAKRDGACFVLREPSMAGPRSPVMMGRACTEPLLHEDGPLALDLFRADDIH